MGESAIQLHEQLPEVARLFVVPETGLPPEAAHAVTSEPAIPSVARRHLRLVPNSEYPDVIVLSDTPEDELDRQRAEAFIRTVHAAGETALKTEVKVDLESADKAAKTPEQSTYPTLMHAIHAAAAGDQVALKVVASNMRTEKLEIAFKSGNINEVEIDVAEDGRLIQFGQSMRDVYGNTLRWGSDEAAIYERSVAETYNGMRMESVYRRGLLRDYYLLAASRYTDKLDDEVAEEFGLFAATKSGALQLLTQTGEGKLVQQSAFVAGVARPGAERHDATTIARLGQRLGVDWSNQTDAQTLAKPILIPKYLLPNGVIDLVKMYDEAAGGTFFGEDKPAQNYLEYREFCRDREAGLELGVQKAVKQLLQEARDGQITDPEMATERLHKLAEQEMIDRAIVDKTIDPRVFGKESAIEVELSRQRLAVGDVQGAKKARDAAVRKGKSGSCPTARRKKKSESGTDDDTDVNTSKTAETKNDDENVEACVIDTSSCYCCTYNADGSPRPTRLTVKAYVDSNKTYHCMRGGCGAWLDKKGKSFKGYIASRAARRAKGDKLAKGETQKAEKVV